MENNCHFPYFGPRNNFLPEEHVSKNLESYISTDKKYIKSLLKVNEADNQNLELKLKT
jgi:hypothetical protein